MARDTTAKGASECSDTDFWVYADVVNFWLPAGQNRIGNHAQNLAQSLANLRDRTETVSCIMG